MAWKNFAIGMPKIWPLKPAFRNGSSLAIGTAFAEKVAGETEMDQPKDCPEVEIEKAIPAIPKEPMDVVQEASEESFP
jgi:hypothetical protein